MHFDDLRNRHEKSVHDGEKNQEFSSFEEVLFLDSDAFPVQEPEALLDCEPFTTTGLVLWPDFWYMSESPAYFAISSQAMPSLKERQSTESGEIMYSSHGM